MDDVNVVLGWLMGAHDIERDYPMKTLKRLEDEQCPVYIANRYLNMSDWQDAKLLIKFGEWLLQELKK